MRLFTMALQIFNAPWPCSFFLLNKELPPIPPCALAQSKNDLANVLDVGFLFSLMCVRPFRHDHSIHRHLDYGVILGKRLLIIICLFLKLFLQRLQGTRHHASHIPNKLIVFRLASRLFTFHELLALEHIIANILNKRFPQVAHFIFKFLLEVCALRIVLGYVFKFPSTNLCVLFLQRLIDEDMRATNLT